MKVYTKTGDRGETSLIGGTRVRKNDVRLDAYGGVDELNAQLGMIRSYPLPDQLSNQLVEIQRTLFVIGGSLATDTTTTTVKQQLVCTDEDLLFLEEAIDRMESDLPPLKYFVLPGGDPLVSFCHIARTVCRRVERRILDLQENVPVDAHILCYINRLSDYLFVLSRKLANDREIEEIRWEPKK